MLKAASTSSRCAATLLLGTLTSSALALQNGPIDAWVSDAVSHEPVAGAIVVVTWERVNSSIASSWVSCEHLQVAVSDAQGRYHIDRWSNSFLPFGWFAEDYTLVIRAYRAGMIYPVPPVESFDPRNGNVQMVVFAGSQTAHMNYLWHVAIWDCGYRGDDAKALRPLRETVYAEAQTIATHSAEDQKTLTALWGQIHQREGAIATAPQGGVNR